MNKQVSKKTAARRLSKMIEQFPADEYQKELYKKFPSTHYLSNPTNIMHTLAWCTFFRKNLHRFVQDYLEIPISIGYKLIINTKSNIFFDFGPYLAYGLFGNYNIDYAELENDKKDLFTCGAYKRFDFGCQGNIGINITNFQIGIGAVQSIIKPTKDIWNLENPKEKSFLLNISYFLNR